jgi:hypothetical protein
LGPLLGTSEKVLLGIVIACGFLMCTSAKLTPGGPFISISGDLLPLFGSFFAVLAARRLIHIRRGLRRWASVCLLVAAVGIMCFVIFVVVSWWIRPYSRGYLFGL